MILISTITDIIQTCFWQSCLKLLSVILQISDYEKLVAFENQLKEVFESYCLRSLSIGVQMEWMEGMSFEDAEKKIKDEFKNI